MTHETFASWLKSQSLTQEQAAERLGLTQPGVSRILRGGRPSVDTAHAIDRLTGGEIAWTSWFQPSPDVAAE